MNKVYTHTEIARKEQSVIRLRHMNSGPNGCLCQPRPRLGRQKANLTLNHGNTRRINLGHWRINLKPRLPEYPTRVVIMRMDPETLLQSAERTDVSTMSKLMPLGGWTVSNSIHQNSKVACNPKSSWWQEKIKKKNSTKKSTKEDSEDGA
jgi:hypothetical protein